MEVRLRHLLALIGFLALLGCGGPYDATVNGTVTLDGSPVPRGTVTFNPESAGPSAYSSIQGDGSYRIQTGRDMGLPSDEYIVTVVASEEPVVNRSEDGGPPPPGKPITPPWYRSKQTSGLKYTVESGRNEINIELSTEPPPDWKPPRRRRRR